MRLFTLPLFLTEKTRLLAGFLLFPLAGLLYLFTNHFQFFAARELPMTWLDTHVPFVPNTFWVYASEFLYFPAAYLLCRDVRNVNRYLYSFAALQIASNLIFVFWPTVYLRENFPLHADVNEWTRFGVTQMRTADTPANCCPSLHVSGVLLTGFLFIDEQRKWLAPFMIWGVAIAISTLTTKQHYLIDVLAGFAMAALFYWIFHRRFRYAGTKSP